MNEQSSGLTVNRNLHTDDIMWGPAYSTSYNALESALYIIFKDKFELFCKKQMDYGPFNISKFGEYGVLIRTSDKVERMINLSKRITLKEIPANESIDDTWSDILLYAAIALLIRQGSWPIHATG